MTGQVAQDLDDDEHSTKFEKLTLTIASGHARTPVHLGTSRELLGHTSRAEEVCETEA